MASGGTALSEVANQRVRVALSPVATVFSLTLEALGCQRGSPQEWPQTIRRSLTTRDLAVLGPMFATRGSSCFPDCVLPRPDTFAPSIEEELERIAATPAEQLMEEIESDDGLSDAWRVAAKNPRPWLAAYVTTLDHAWIAAKPLWKRATPLMEREIERVGTALARGALDGLFDGLHPHGYVHDDRLFMDFEPAPMTIGAGMVIAPILGGRSASFTECSGREVNYLAYPLPGARRMWATDSAPTSGASLDALLGEPRAKILRSLDHPRLAGSLARNLHAAPSAVTHHLAALERAGLVRRERDGRNVLVCRTARGTALAGLYDH